MGQSSLASRDHSEFTVIQELSNGTIIKEHNDSSTLHFLKQYAFTNQDAYQKAFIKYSRKMADRHQHILALEKVNTNLENTFCSTFYKIVLVYEYIGETLEQEIIERAKTSHFFDEKDIWSIFCSCILGLAEMTRLEGGTHKALKLSDIKLTPESGVKILSGEMAVEDDNYSELSPGLILLQSILECCTLKKVENQSCEHMLNLTEKLDYSAEFKNTLKMMLDSRISFVDIEDHLFKLVQDQTEVSSLSNTPNLKSNNKTFQKSPFPQSSKVKETVPLTMAAINVPDIEDLPQTVYYVFECNEVEKPDENQPVEEEEKVENQRSQAEVFRSYAMSQENNAPLAERNSNVFFRADTKINKIEGNSRNISTGQNSHLFTDPKLMSLINSELQQIKKKQNNQTQSNLQQPTNHFHTHQSSSFQTSSHDNGQVKYFEEAQRKSKISKQFNSKNNVNWPPSESFASKVSAQEIKNQPKEENSERPSRVSYLKQNTKNFDSSQMKIQNENAEQEEKCEYHIVKNNATLSYADNLRNSILDHEPSRCKQQIDYIFHQESSNSKESQKSIEEVCENYTKGRFEGTKKNGMRHGQGTFHYSQGGKYVGQWFENKMNGRGVLYYPNSNIAYEGNWKNDQLHGFGVLYNEEVVTLKGPFDYRDWGRSEDYWVKYQGQFVQDNKEGSGKLYLSNGEIFEGSFKNDLVEGEGTLYRKGGNRVKGLWKQNELVRMF